MATRNIYQEDLAQIHIEGYGFHWEGAARSTSECKTMRQFCELRLNEEYAHLLFAASEGERLGYGVRKVVLSTDDPRFHEVERLNREIFARDDRSFFTYSRLFYRYNKADVASAKLFHVLINAVFEPAGEECGTVYDETNACPHVFSAPKEIGGVTFPKVVIPAYLCGVGRVQVSELKLDLRKAPKTKDIARTIADEWIVSQRLSERMLDAGLTGFELRPVRHKARYQDDPIDLTEVPTGRKLLLKAQELGLEESKWEFDVWLNRPEQRETMRLATAEYAERRTRRADRSRKPIPVWYQLVVTSKSLPMIPPTLFGIDAFDPDVEGQYRCSYSHVAGLNLRSEIHVARDGYDGSDIVCTENMTGARVGLLVAAPQMLISPRFWELLQVNKVKGYEWEVAYSL